MYRLTQAFQRRPLLLGALSLFALLAIIYAFSVDIRASRGASITGDEPFYLLTTQSLVDDQDLDLTNQYETASYKSFFDHPDDLWKQSVPNDDGELLSPHNPGLSVFVLPGFAIGGLEGTQIQLLVTAAITFALAYVLVSRMTGAHLISWFATLAVGTSATAFIYSTEIYPEVPAALTLVLALLVILPSERHLGWPQAIMLAALLTAMVWLGVKYAPLAAIVAVAYLWRADAAGRVTLVGVGAASAAVFAGWHVATFGELTPYSVNAIYAGDSTGSVVESHLTLESERVYRLWGVFIDRRFGIARWAPILLLALPGMILLLKRDVVDRTVVALISAQLLMGAFVWITIMGWWFPGRTMMTVLPLFAVPITVLIAGHKRWALPVAVVLGTYSTIVSVGLAYAGLRREVVIAVDPFDMGFEPFTVVARAFPQYTSWGLETQAQNAAWLAIGGLLLIAFAVQNFRPRGRTSAPIPTERQASSAAAEPLIESGGQASA